MSPMGRKHPIVTHKPSSPLNTMDAKLALVHESNFLKVFVFSCFYLEFAVNQGRLQVEMFLVCQ